MKTAGYRPFPWERLAAVSEAEAALATRAAAWVPGAREQRWPEAFETFWSELVGAPFQVECLGFSSYSSGRFAAPAGDHFVTEFEFPPVRAAGVIAIDTGLVESWLDSTVGSSNESARFAELGERDRAVINYLVIRCAEFFTERGAPPAAVATQRIAASDAFSRLARHMGVVEIDFVCTSPSCTGLVRIYVPAGLMEAFDGWTKRTSVPSPTVGRLRVPCWLSIGHVRLTPIEIANLGPGDIVFPNRDPVGSDREAAVLIGPSAVAAEASNDTENWNLEVASRDDGGLKMENRTASPEEATSQLVDSVDLRLDFVVGNESLSVADLSRLQPGRVFVTNRSVGEPIDLIVNDHVVAKGELVDVEGRVGVRVISISGR